MEDQFVPYEITLKLKELGFKEKCLGSFWHVANKGIILIMEHESLDRYSGHPKFLCDAPLWQEAFDWLMEKTNYRVIPNIHKTLDNRYYVSGKHYNALIEAKEACLLRLIELIKSATTLKEDK